MQTGLVDTACPEGDRCFNKSAVSHWAIAAITIFALLRIRLGRRFRLWLNNAFAIVKLAFLLALILIGTIYGFFYGNKKGEKSCQHFYWNPEGQQFSLSIASRTLLDIASAFLIGFEQPFYELDTSSTEKRGRYLLLPAALAAALSMVLSALVNFAYICVLPPDTTPGRGDPPWTGLVQEMFDIAVPSDGTNMARSTISSLLVLFTLGRMSALLCSMSTEVQEISKPGILPYSPRLRPLNANTLTRLLWGEKGRNESQPRHPDQIGNVILIWLWTSALVTIYGTLDVQDPSASYDTLTRFAGCVSAVICLITILFGMSYRIIAFWGKISESWIQLTRWVSGRLMLLRLQMTGALLSLAGALE